jgi:hypothetical protein
MTEITERLLVAIASVINDVRSMQAGEADSEKDWFEGFSTWEYDTDDDGGDDTISIEWPNLAKSVDNLDAAFKELYELRQAKVQAEIDEITTKMVQT